jgi:WS/DGAT/MGAT family acyltransferase
VVVVAIERLSAEDRMLLLSDRAWPQDVGVLLLLEAGELLDARGQVRIEVAREAVARALPGLPRLRQVVRVPRPGLGGPFWVDAPALDLAHHVRVGPPVDAGDEPALLRAVEEIRSRRLDLGRPLWEVWLLPGPAGVAMFVRMHHVVADGVAGVASLAALLRDPSPPGPGAEPDWVTRPEPSARQLLADTVRRRGRAVRTGRAALRHPWSATSSAVAGWRATRDLVSGEPGPVTSLAGLVGPHRRLALLRASLGDLEAVAHAQGATVNDLLLASIAGGVRALLTGRGEALDHLCVPVLVPVSLRRGTDDPAWGNQISQMRVELPVGEPEADARLHRITEATSRAKALHHPSLGLAFGNRVLSAIVLRLVVRQRINLLSADIVGPTKPMSFAGTEVRDAFPLINLLGNVTLGVGALSYAGRFEVLVVADADLYPDLDTFAVGAADELRALGAAASTKDLRP